MAIKKNNKTLISPYTSIKILLVGYNGANNTGSEARLLTIIEELKDVFGSNVQITVPTLNEKNLRRYLKEDPYIHIEPVPPIFFRAVRRLVKDHDLVLLVEGSCYMDTWTSALLWAFLYATRCAHNAGVPCIAYAVDSGKLSTFNRYLVKKEANKTDLIITRTKRAAHDLREIGVSAPIEITADCAFKFNPRKEDENILQENWPESGETLVGLAVVDFNLWPVVIRPWGKNEDLYRWPYYFSRSKARKKKSEELARGWARQADEIIEKNGHKVALICMEEVDEPLARDILEKMENSESTRIFSSSEYNASQMTHILRHLSLLVTSRYHAGVLSLKAGVPQIAVGHDTRLKGFYQELGIQEFLIDSCSPDIWKSLKQKIEQLIENPDKEESRLKNGFNEHLSRASLNQELLKEFLKKKGM
ncbi:MAG TPA: polysaccharide pyruvyl transferase family protein [Methanobacterium sp.]|nr:polysaccharide pyruvyl transferase family protein [Methanobacterium sp.]